MTPEGPQAPGTASSPHHSLINVTLHKVMDFLVGIIFNNPVTQGEIRVVIFKTCYTGLYSNSKKSGSTAQARGVLYVGKILKPGYTSHSSGDPCGNIYKRNLAWMGSQWWNLLDIPWILLRVSGHLSGWVVSWRMLSLGRAGAKSGCLEWEGGEAAGEAIMVTLVAGFMAVFLSHHPPPAHTPLPHQSDVVCVLRDWPHPTNNISHSSTHPSISIVRWSAFLGMVRTRSSCGPSPRCLNCHSPSLHQQITLPTYQQCYFSPWKVSQCRGFYN